MPPQPMSMDGSLVEDYGFVTSPRPSASRSSANKNTKATSKSSSSQPGGGISLASLGVGSGNTDSEFYSPVPDGYIRGAHKYIAVFGTVISGLGKGIFASSIAKILKDKGMSVAPIKLEGYLNFDSGTLNPYRHGEVFVLDDGTECDMDLGTYERVLDQNLSVENFTTSGRIFSEILERERQGVYLGRDVQVIPHYTGEVKRKLRELALIGDGKNPADVVIIEVGGTVGDYENNFFIEAIRQLAFEEGPNSCCFVALTYVIEPKALGEQKSKAAQLGIKRLLEAGVQPHMIGCRASNPVNEKVMQKIAMFSNVPLRRTFSMHDRESIYTIPEDMRHEGLDREILSILNLHDRVDVSHEDKAREKWTSFVTKLTTPPKREVSIGIAGKYANLRDAYASIDKSLEHCAAHLCCKINTDWIDTTDVNDSNVAAMAANLDGVIVPGGFGSRGVEGKISAVRYCRENGIPYLGICLGFQVAVIEFARNVLGLSGANSTEFDINSPFPVISELPEQKQIEGLGGSMRLGAQDVILTPNSLASFLYGKVTQTRERFRHRYEVDPKFIQQLEQGGLVFSGRHPSTPIMQVLELRQGEQKTSGPRVTHPYFIAGQFHPELLSRPLHPAPLFMGLISAAISRKYLETPATTGTSQSREQVHENEFFRWVRGKGEPQSV